jgi:hypothetical protein
MKRPFSSVCARPGCRRSDRGSGTRRPRMRPENHAYMLAAPAPAAASPFCKPAQLCHRGAGGRARGQVGFSRRHHGSQLRASANLSSMLFNRHNTSGNFSRVLDPRQQLGERDGLSAGGEGIRTLGPLPRGCPPILGEEKGPEVDQRGLDRRGGTSGSNPSSPSRSLSHPMPSMAIGARADPGIRCCAADAGAPACRRQGPTAWFIARENPFAGPRPGSAVPN